MSEHTITQNLHTHTWRCKHAKGDVQQFIGAALDAGVNVLGITDHCPLPDGKWASTRMDISDLNDYTREIETAIGRNRDNPITILKGMECDWGREYYQFYQEELLDKRSYHYLIGSVHYFLLRGDWINACRIENASQLIGYTNAVIKAMECGLFLFIAHPDMMGTGYCKWDENSISASKDILSAAEALKVPLELNGNGMRRKHKGKNPENPWPYPLYRFWEIAAGFDITVVCNSDAHNPKHVIQNIGRCMDIVDKYKLIYADFSFLAQK